MTACTCVSYTGVHCVGSHVLVYKLGGASLSVTVMQVNGGIFRVLNTHTDNSVGGESFTEALAQHLATDFKRSAASQPVLVNPSYRCCLFIHVFKSMSSLPLVSYLSSVSIFVCTVLKTLVSESVLLSLFALQHLQA